MYAGHLANAGQMRDQLRFFRNSGDVNEYGEPVVTTEYLVQCRGEVRVKSGGEADKYGTTISTRVITVRMWYNKDIAEDMTMDWVNDSGRYTVKHIKPDERKRTMIVTAFLEASVMYSGIPATTAIGDTETEFDPIVIVANGTKAFHVIDHNFPVTPTVIFTDQEGDEVTVNVTHLSSTSVQVSGNSPLTGLITVKSGI